MAVQQPSQYNVDNMKQGDVVFVKQRPLLYRLYRKFFTNKPKIKVRKFWVPEGREVEYNVYYQEDCTLLYYYEVSCVQKFENEVPVAIGKNGGAKIIKTLLLKEFQVGLYNVMLQFDNGISLTLPIDYFNAGNRKNTILLKQIEDQRKIEDLLKFQKYKGDYFKNYVVNNKLEEWEAAYCSVCGSPVIFEFTDNLVKINNKCNCGELKLDKSELSYDELSIWYYSQVNPNVKDRYDRFWFKKE